MGGRATATLVLLAVLAGCERAESPERAAAMGAEPLRLEDPFERHAGSALDVRAEPGAGLLARALRSDPTLRSYLVRNPDPDLLYPLGARHLKLIYLRADRVATFVRDQSGVASREHTRQPIPEPFLARLPAVFQASVRGARGAATQPVEPDRAISTCFVVRPDGYLLTAHHAVDGARELRVRLADGRVLGATVERVDVDHDLAVLRVDAEGLDYLALGDPDEIRHGTRIFTIGFPAVTLLGREPKFAEGAVSSLGRAPAGYAMQLSLPVLPGNSGGPVLDLEGRVLGVLTRTATPQSFLSATGVLPQDVSFATRVEFALPLFDAAAAPPAAPSREAAIERALDAVCSIDASL